MRSMFFTFTAAVALLLGGCGSQQKDETIERAMQIQGEGAAKGASPSAAPKITPAYRYAINCAKCHGQSGEGKGEFPRLAGQGSDNVLLKLKGYRDGSFGGTQKALMAAQIKPLHEDELEPLARFIATLK